MSGFLHAFPVGPRSSGNLRGTLKPYQEPYPPQKPDLALQNTVPGNLRTRFSTPTARINQENLLTE